MRGRSKIFDYAEEGNFSGVMQKINSYPILLNETDNTKTLLHIAASKGYTKIATYLIDQGISLNAKVSRFAENDYRKTALHIAAEHDYSDIVAMLINAGANTTCTKFYTTANYHVIHIAAMNGSLSTIKFLLNHRPALLEKKDELDQTALLWASAKGHTHVVEYLILQGANLNVRTYILRGHDENGKTPLYWATESGYDTIVSLLINAGASIITAVGHMNFQPIHIAAIKGHLPIIKMLLEKDPFLIEQKDALHQTPLLLASSKGHAAIVEYLIQKGANLNVKTYLPYHYDHGKNSLSLALKYEFNSIVDVFIKHFIMLDLQKEINEPTLSLSAINKLLPIKDEIINKVKYTSYTHQLSKRHSKMLNEIQKQINFFLEIYSNFEGFLPSQIAWIIMDYYLHDINLLTFIKKFSKSHKIEENLSKNISSKKMLFIFNNPSSLKTMEKNTVTTSNSETSDIASEKKHSASFEKKYQKLNKILSYEWFKKKTIMLKSSVEEKNHNHLTGKRTSQTQK